MAKAHASTIEQADSGLFGMIVFLASEAMLFGAVILGLLAVRAMNPAAFAETSGHLDLIAGTANTAILLTSSLLVALGGEAAEGRRRRLAAVLFAAAALLGLLFLMVKAGEYATEYGEGLLPAFGSGEALGPGGSRLFMNAYLFSTLLHALHVTIGVGLLGFLALRLRRTPVGDTLHRNIGRYWHLVDVVWVFLFPILYLSR